MIVRQREDEFVLIQQHHHALLSGELAGAMSHGILPEGRYRCETVHAIAQHDCGWKELDAMPIWNDAAGGPFTFVDYPILPKIAYYKKGLDEVEAVSPYAGLLCSLFYSAFFKDMTEPECVRFRQREEQRQLRLRANLNVPLEYAERGFQLLQLCDSLSLYVCLNEPGASKLREHPWYREGFPGSERFTTTGAGPIVAEWIDEISVRLDEFPLSAPLRAQLPYKSVAKARIREIGLYPAYSEAKWRQQHVLYCP
ncbi:DUF3891 family protein [Paenibacillus beijingensis]|uniref:Uncharacterized protein n=1 Tax=Paenibacillus beijingensis TaxID=1126833 RepID=A0A0D5NDW8_9BACL|nr:DUF3891 family protein [Paenibacillus beijingensis]AJY73345.1 hypothetical protein VN24_00255 [Paenibacillus beijingensis]